MLRGQTIWTCGQTGCGVGALRMTFVLKVRGPQGPPCRGSDHEMCRLAKATDLQSSDHHLG